MPENTEVHPLKERQSIHSGDPDAVFIEEAKLLAVYSEQIDRDADDILARFPGPEKPIAAATAYIAKVGENIPDETIKSAVKKLAASKFRSRGM
jgi:hypothetical protein